MYPSKKIIVVMIMFLLLTTSCWNSRELNELAFVAAIAIDKGPEPQTINLTCQVIKPAEMQSGGKKSGGSSESSKPYYNVTASGRTVFEAVRKISTMIDRRPYFPHLQVLIFSEEIAREGLAQYLDLFTRDPEIRGNSSIVICKGKAMDILDAKTELNEIPGNSIDQLLELRKTSSLAIGVTLLKFNQRLLTESTAPLASYIEFDKNDKSVRLVGAATFKKDKLSGILNEEETRGLLLILNEIKAGITVIDCPDFDGKVSIELVSSKSELKPEIKDGKPQFLLTIYPRVHLSEQTCSGDLSTPDKVKSLKDNLAQEITGEINSSLKKARESRCDIFGFGSKIQQRYPKYWQEIALDWEEVFPLTPVEIKINVQLDNTGMSTKPVRSLKK